MTLERVQIVGAIAPGENASVHGRVQRFHAPVHHFGEPCHLGDVRHPKPGGREGAGRATRRHERVASVRQAPTELHELGLV